MDKFLHLSMASLISALEKGGHSTGGHVGILLRRSRLICQFVAELYIEWRATHNDSRLVHDWLLNLMASDAGSGFRFTQFIRSHGHLLVDAILWIFWLKKVRLVCLMVFLYAFHSWSWPVL